MRLLLAENDPHLQVVLTKVLRRTGYEVVVVADGAAVPGMLEVGQYDLLVIDYRIQHMSGLELVRILHAGRRSATPVVVLSDPLPVSDEIREWQRVGGASWMLKPFDLSALGVVLAEALKGPPAG